MTEIFKDIPGYKGLYEISNTGRLKSLAHVDQSGHKRQEKMISPAVGSSGYLSARLHNSKQKTYNIHQLLAMAFLGHKLYGHKLVIDHIDFNKLKNELDNLRIISASENS